MEEKGSNFTEECYGLMPMENLVAVWAAICVHVLSMVVIVTFAHEVSVKVDIDHPVFAVIHQELKVVVASETVICLLFGVSLIHHMEVLLLLMCIMSVLSMQFHQLSWLGITILRYTVGLLQEAKKDLVFLQLLYRYYLLVIAKGSDFDIALLRQRSKKLILISALPFVIMCQIPWLCILLWHGWPEVPISDLKTDTFLWLSSSTIVLSNAPDFASILIYIKMVWHFHHKNLVVLPLEPVINFAVDPGDLADFGGIWVGGGDMDSQDSGINPSADDHVDQRPNTPPPPPNVQDNNAPKSEHDVKSVMRVLKWHVSLCLVDALLSVSSAFLCSKFGHGILHTAVLVSAVWIPFLVIKCNFKNLKDVGNFHCVKLFCCKVR